MTKLLVDRAPDGTQIEVEFPDADPKDFMPVAAVVTVRTRPGIAPSILAAAIRRAGTFSHEAHLAHKK